VKLEVEREFYINHPGSADQGVAFVQDVQRSLQHVAFIKNLRLDGSDVLADLSVDVPVLGEQRLDFHSRLEACSDGANLIPLPRSGKAWAEVGGEGRVTPNGSSSSLTYRLRIVVHVELPTAERWGGRAFEKMVQATAQRAIERMTEQFPVGVQAAMPK
jgi:carbon monoxide dehydrogenase subunit G